MIYFNSLFVNVYTILENSLDKFCNKYCCDSVIFIKKKGKNESSISFYNRVIKQYIDVKNTELRAKMDLMDKTYRNIRNCLVHKRHNCANKDIKNIRNFDGIKFRSNHYSTDLFEITIENEKTITDFVHEVRLLIKNIYDSFRKFE